MKKYFAFFVLCVFFSGCAEIATVPSSETVAPVVFTPDEEAGFTNMKHVHVGMTYEEVTSIMGHKITVGYKRNEQFLGGFGPIVLKSPYRAEIIRSHNSIYNVFYYFTNVKKADNIVAEDELTPLVFKDNKLVGKGRDFLFKLKEKLKNKG